MSSNELTILSSSSSSSSAGELSLALSQEGALVAVQPDRTTQWVREALRSNDIFLLKALIRLGENPEFENLKREYDEVQSIYCRELPEQKAAFLTQLLAWLSHYHQLELVAENPHEEQQKARLNQLLLTRVRLELLKSQNSVIAAFNDNAKGRKQISTVEAEQVAHVCETVTSYLRVAASMLDFMSNNRRIQHFLLRDIIASLAESIYMAMFEKVTADNLEPCLACFDPILKKCLELEWVSASDVQKISDEIRDKLEDHVKHPAKPMSLSVLGVLPQFKRLDKAKAEEKQAESKEVSFEELCGLVEFIIRFSAEYLENNGQQFSENIKTIYEIAAGVKGWLGEEEMNNIFLPDKIELYIKKVKFYCEQIEDLHEKIPHLNEKLQSNIFRRNKQEKEEAVRQILEDRHNEEEKKLHTRSDLYRLNRLDPNTVRTEEEIKQCLSNWEVDVNDMVDSNGNRLLHYAFHYNRVDAALYLVRMGGDVENAKNIDGRAPIDLIEKEARPAFMKALSDFRRQRPFSAPAKVVVSQIQNYHNMLIEERELYATCRQVSPLLCTFVGSVQEFVKFLHGVEAGTELDVRDGIPLWPQLEKSFEKLMGAMQEDQASWVDHKTRAALKKLLKLLESYPNLRKYRPSLEFLAGYIKSILDTPEESVSLLYEFPLTTTYRLTEGFPLGTLDVLKRDQLLIEREEKRHLEETLQKALAEEKMAKEKSEKLKRENEGLKGENEGLKGENEGLKGENEGLKKSIANLESKLADNTRDIKAIQAVMLSMGIKIPPSPSEPRKAPGDASASASSPLKAGADKMPDLPSSAFFSSQMPAPEKAKGTPSGEPKKPSKSAPLGKGGTH